jgi:hypothetical protein
LHRLGTSTGTFLTVSGHETCCGALRQ